MPSGQCARFRCPMRYTDTSQEKEGANETSRTLASRLDNASTVSYSSQWVRLMKLTLAYLHIFGVRDQTMLLFMNSLSFINQGRAQSRKATALILSLSFHL